MASNAEKVSIWWRLHAITRLNGLRIDTSRSHVPSCTVATKPTRIGLNPLNGHPITLWCIFDSSNLIWDLLLSLPWWRHQMETFSELLAICAGNSPVPAEFLAQKPVTRNFDVFFDLRLNKQRSKQPWGWWFETLSCPLWRHCNAVMNTMSRLTGRYQHREPI